MLTLYFHPLASYCWKSLIALYENSTPFTPRVIDLGDEKHRAELAALWPPCEFPVLRDESKRETIAPSTAIFEYLHTYYPGPQALIPADPRAAIEARRWAAYCDSDLHVHMQKIVADTFRPAGKGDATGVEEARAAIQIAYGHLETVIRNRTWLAGETFTIADCSAAPALFYADQVEVLSDSRHPGLLRYLERLKQRPSFARVLIEAKPVFHYFPFAGKHRPAL